MSRGLVYRLTCSETGLSYIGKTAASLDVRWASHVRSARRGSDGCQLLWRAIRKYGPDAFAREVLASALQSDSLDDLERRLIAQHGTMAPGGMNLTEGGDGGRQAPEVRAVMSAKASSESRLEMLRAPAFRAAQAELQTARYRDSAERSRTSEAVRAAFAKPGEREKQRAVMARAFTPEVVARRNAAIARANGTPEARRQISERGKAAHANRSPEKRAEISARISAALTARNKAQREARAIRRTIMPLDVMQPRSLMETMGFLPANHSHAVLFGAAMKPVFDEHGEPVPDFRRLVREDTGKTLEVVGKSYAFIDNRAIFGEFEKAITESGLDATDMMVGTDFANDGRRCFRTYIFPAHTETIRPGVDLALRIVMFNSFDRSTSFTGRAGHYSFVCANQAIVGKDVAGGRFALKHTGELKTAEAITGLVAAAEQHVEQVKRLRIWPQIEVSDTKARELICAMDGLSDKQIDHLVHQWVRAKDDTGPQGGPNLWSMFAAMTAWATHGDTAVGGMATGASKAGALAPKVRAMREDQVAKVIECEEWADLEAAG